MTIKEKSSSRGTGAIGIAIVVVIIVSIIGIWLVKSQSSDKGAMRQVTYIVYSDGGYAQIIYTSSVDVNTAPAMMTTPFTRTIALPVGTEVFLTASNPSQNGQISCEIKIDNREWKFSKGTHPIDSVACGGILR
ncbi:MAG: hypothetical protein CVU42_02580 [Chloroflexi bacterium HGW-Chloroflexi-4]|jgi:hypothetical protein|nr:MAG: hypothetical protein CVU42_02580 [Chloroflexi bacterium HGW-Chloroflexi-4]